MSVIAERGVTIEHLQEENKMCNYTHQNRRVDEDELESKKRALLPYSIPLFISLITVLSGLLKGI